MDQNQRGTLTANLLGVALASFFLVLMERHGSDAQRHFFLPGFCGGLTTFSAVTLLSLQENSGTFLPDGSGLLYLVKTIALSLLVVAICIPLARKFIPAKP